MSYRLLDHFRSIFDGQPYLHRRSNHGDVIARCFYEDLYSIGRSATFKERVDSLEYVVNVANVVIGRKGRRGDGTFGESIPYEKTVQEPGFRVALGHLANIEIGVEVKILQKAMIKQIDRVEGDLTKQFETFKGKHHRSITVAFVGVNHAEQTTSYEGARAFLAVGSQSPAVEAPKAIARLEDVSRKYDDLLFLRFKITNIPPFPFEWVNESETIQRYGALLVRVLRKYEERFKTSQAYWWPNSARRA